MGVDLGASVGLHVRADEAAHVRDHLEAMPESCDVHMALGMLDFVEARFEESRRHLEAAYLGFQSEARPRRAAVAAAHLAKLAAIGVGNTALAAGWLARAQRMLGEEDCVERGWVALYKLGCSRPDVERLAQDADVALDTARRFGDRDLECLSLAESGLALVTQGCLDDGMARIDEALTMTLCGECDNIVVTSLAHCSLIAACDRAGDLPRVEGWISEMLADPGTSLVMGNHCRTTLGSLLSRAGRWSEADDQLKVSLAMSRHASQIAEVRSELADLRLQQGRIAEAAQLLAEVESTAEALPALARLHQARGDHALAAATARSALEEFRRDVLRGVRLHLVVVESELALGRLPEARRALEQMRAQVGEVRTPPVQARLALAEAKLALAEEHADHAAAILRGVLGDLGRGWPLLSAECRLSLATVLSGIDRTAAITEARRILAELHTVESTLRARAKSLLRELGVSREEGTGHQPSCLSAREREVLALLGDGLSNPEIARRLVISPRTVEHHVAAVLRKLHLRNRREAIRYVATLAQQPAPALRSPSA